MYVCQILLSFKTFLRGSGRPADPAAGSGEGRPAGRDSPAAGPGRPPRRLQGLGE